MKYLLIMLLTFMAGCTTIDYVNEDIDYENDPMDKKVIYCVKEFLNKGVKATVSHDICKDVYKRAE